MAAIYALIELWVKDSEMENEEINLLHCCIEILASTFRGSMSEQFANLSSLNHFRLLQCLIQYKQIGNSSQQTEGDIYVLQKGLLQKTLEKVFAVLPDMICDRFGLPLAAIKCFSQFISITNSFGDISNAENIRRIDQICTASPFRLSLIMLAILIIQNFTQFARILDVLLTAGCDPNASANLDVELITQIQEIIPSFDQDFNAEIFRDLCESLGEEYSSINISTLAFAYFLQRMQYFTLLIERGARIEEVFHYSSFNN